MATRRAGVRPVFRLRQPGHPEPLSGRRTLQLREARQSAGLQAEIDSWPGPAGARQADGWATIETYTVKHSRDGARTGLVIGRLDADGRRFVARGDDRDPALADLLSSAAEPIGERVYVRSSGSGNRVTRNR